jgi:hypothetical protein
MRFAGSWQVGSILYFVTGLVVAARSLAAKSLLLLKKMVVFLRSCPDFVVRVHIRLHAALFGRLNRLLCLCVPTYIHSRRQRAWEFLWTLSLILPHD